MIFHRVNLFYFINMGTNQKDPCVAITILGPKYVGGAEKRYVNIYKILRAKNTNVFLVINKNRFEALSRVCELNFEDSHIIIIKTYLDKKISENTEKVEQASSSESSRRIYQKHVRKLFSTAKAYYNFYNIYSQLEKIRKTKRVDLFFGVFIGAYALAPYFFTRKVATAISYNDSSFGGLEKSFLKWFTGYWLALKYADQVDFLSDFIYNGLAERGFTIESRRCSIANISFIDYSKCFTGVVKEDAIAFCGRFEPYKNPLLFVEAASLVLQKYPQVKFYMMGDGPLGSAIRKKINDLHLNNNIKISFSERPEKTLAKTKIFVSLQETNNFPSQSLLEAMACGNAIVASHVGETDKLVDKDIGRLVPNHKQEIAGAIIDLLHDENKLRLQGEAARKRALNDYTVENFLSYFESVTQKAIQNWYNSKKDA